MEKPSATEVRAIITIPASVVDATVEGFIDDAEALVSQCSVVASSSATKQKAIIKWVTAHMLSNLYGTAGPLGSKALGDASKSYASGFRQYGSGLASTHYGQQALLLEPTGCLANLGKQAAFLKVL